MAKQRLQAGRPYNDLTELPPDTELETKLVLRACISARAALAELKTAVELIPNPAILINTLPILEARASSEIENIVTTTDELFRFAANESAATDAATREALRYRTALGDASATLARRPINTTLASRICSALRGIQTDVRRLPGTTLRHQGTGKDVYTPPEGESRLRSLLANWERFLHDGGELDPLIRMAVAHYQFEAIHPFEDGNGRTGRILNLLFLVEQGLLTLPVLYLSGAINRTKPDYYRLLLGVTTDRRWEPWLLYMLHAVEETATWTTNIIRSIRAMHAETARVVRARAPKIYTRELIDALFVQPYCRIGNLVDAGIAKRQTASTYLSTLAGLGIVAPLQAGREKLFVNTDLLELLKVESQPRP